MLDEPEAKQVFITGSFCDWEPTRHALKKNKEGIWETTLPLMPGSYEYRYLVDGIWHNDPQCEECVPNPFGGNNCVVHVSA
jgi:1,4-alpha-glucan branching enzyme